MLDAQSSKTCFRRKFGSDLIRVAIIAPFKSAASYEFCISRLMASKSEAFRERSRSPVAQAKADEPQDLEIVLEPLLPDSQEPPAVFDPLIERIIFNAVADNQMAALRGLPQIDIEALRKELESFGNGPTPVSE